MDIQATLDADCTPEVLFAEVGDLDGYDAWLEIVPRTDRTDPDEAGAPAWHVLLRGRLGPLARSKRLRMVRTEHRPPEGGRPGLARFERREEDGREHAPWVLTATVTAHGDGARLTMDLHYGGSLWVPLLDRLLAGEIEASRTRLRSRVEG